MFTQSKAGTHLIAVVGDRLLNRMGGHCRWTGERGRVPVQLRPEGESKGMKGIYPRFWNPNVSERECKDILTYQEAKLYSEQQQDNSGV